ncbi:hypothetical protein AJ80_01280 [Polytolypa hystricis UAMH7299]|uniref:ERCC1-like central domain-containing protein n=1 Tax=Polytolypa hystricis (strain UAMH7299) TaxID=1447883 RepID=A0A2B7Z1I1_POLH7|nr:hypothetical protein AJ80_01280 [Polytolypa hystricis UAMH7299]
MDEDFGEVPDFGALIGAPTQPARPATSAPPPRPSPARPAPAGNKVQQPKPQALPTRSGPSAILVSARQKGNPILNHVRLLPWEYADIPADYAVGTTTCVLFLSLKYHRLHPEYIYSRIKGLAGKYNLRIVLVMVDIPNHEENLKELSKTSIVNNVTLVLCWSAPEAAHYLELFKSSENAQPTAIRSQQAQTYKDSLVEFVTAPRSINKSDTASLISTFGSLQAAVNATPEQISSVPGWGEKKVQQWTAAVREEFRIRGPAKKTASSRPVRNVVGREELHEDETEVLRSLEREQAGGDILGLDEATSASSTTKRGPPQEDEPGDGIMAALAKLRDKEG